MADADSQTEAGEDAVSFHMHIRDVRRDPVTAEGYERVVQETTRGPIEMRYYPVAGTTLGAIFVGGAGAGSIRR